MSTTKRQHSITILLMSFVDWLSEKIKERRMSQTELAQRLGLTRGAVNNLLSGRSKNPSADTIQKLADIFRVSVDEIYRAANILPAAPEQDDWVRDTQHKLSLLNPDQRETAELIIKALLDKESRNKK